MSKNKNKNKNHPEDKVIHALSVLKAEEIADVISESILEKEKIILPKRSMPFSKGRSFPLPARLRFQYFRTGA